METRNTGVMKKKTILLDGPSTRKRSKDQILSSLKKGIVKVKNNVSEKKKKAVDVEVPTASKKEMVVVGMKSKKSASEAVSSPIRSKRKTKKSSDEDFVEDDVISLKDMKQSVIGGKKRKCSSVSVVSPTRSKMKKEMKAVLDFSMYGDISSNLTTQCRPKGLFQLIQSLSERQKEDVRSIGFGGLLSLNFSRCDMKMLRWFVDNFNPASRMFTIDSFRRFSVTPDDVYDVFMLPRNEGSSVSVYFKGEESPLFSGYSEMYGITHRSPLKSVSDVLRNRLGDGGDDFKRFFVLYAMCSFLTPACNRLLSAVVFKSLEDVSRISKLDWCSYVLDKLCESVRLYKQGSSRYVSGCIVMLQLMYFQRMRWKGIAEPKSLPLLQNWTNEKMLKRCREEAEAGKYGEGELIVDEYPVSCKGKVRGVEFVEQDEVGEASHADVEKNCARKCIKFDLPDGEPDDETIKQIAKDEIHEAFLSYKRDISVVSNYHMQKLLNTKKKIDEKQVGSSTPEMTDSQKFFSDEKLHKYIDEVVQNFLMMKKLASEMPSFELLSPDPPLYEEICTPKEKSVAYSNGDDDISDKDIPSEKELSEAVMSVMSVGSKGKNVADDCCEFWTIKDEVGYLSDFLLYSKKFLNVLDQQHREVVDYCFYEDGAIGMSSDETLFKNGYFHNVPREDMISLLPRTQIYNTVINVWCLMVNARKDFELKRSRFVFNMEHSICLVKIMDQVGDFEENATGIRNSWRTWLASGTSSLIHSVEMIFIPFVYENHYAVGVFNMVDKKFQYLDNRKYDDGDDDFFKVAEILRKQMLIFLGEENHEKADEIATYPFENVEFKWQTANVDLDCGVYMMHHIKHFDGVPYTSPDLTKAGTRRLLRAEICATIVLSNINEARGDVLRKVFNFYQQKPEIKIKIAEQKKKEADEKKGNLKRKLQCVLRTYKPRMKRAGK